MRRIPPLGALRAFEAGARHLSFTRAATELRVTQAAISHQVRQLEDWLGVSLFDRRGHALTLTARGAAYLRELTPVFERMSEATTRLYAHEQGPLRLTVLPSFAACWLLPRLERFRKQHPDLELYVNSSEALWDFLDDRFDVGIRSGLGRWTGLKAEQLATERLAADDLKAGRLVQPFKAVLPNDFSYWLVHPRPLTGRRDVAAFKAWVLEEARSDAGA
ncbi:LysR family transcriptional regulator [Corallococcus exercitus]|uniref:LysR family transcriptional regulator n=1 Tax=Corallococcus exercitus TaxID=2316736 RepID=UPI0035D47764